MRRKIPISYTRAGHETPAASPVGYVHISKDALNPCIILPHKMHKCVGKEKAATDEVGKKKSIHSLRAEHERKMKMC